MSPEARASHVAYAAYEKAEKSMCREEAGRVFLAVYRQEMARAVRQ